MDEISGLIIKMTEFFSGDPKRIQHFIKVHAFAKLIGESEHIDSSTLFTLEAAAVVHDVGIKPAEAKYGKCDGHLQEVEGPAVAEQLLKKQGVSERLIERVCFLVGHHHTYSAIDGIDFQILVEADLLVNYYEDATPIDDISAHYEHFFKTATGRRICKEMFLGI